MLDMSLQLYHRMPASLRSVAASLWGYYLRSWRYTGETEKLIYEAFERERWGIQKWQSWQEEQLCLLLRRAATQVPYYREYWSDRRRHGNSTSYEYIENWPVLEKDIVRRQPRAFLATDSNPFKMYHEHTSGTTGKPLDLWWSRDTVQKWYAFFEARCRRWHGVTRFDRWAILGGQLVTPVAQRRPPFWVWNAGLNQLYMSSYHLAPDLIPHYLDALSKYRIKHIFGYSSALYPIAKEALVLGRRDLELTVAVTNAEPLFEYQRQAISAAFHCPVRETYGMAEIVAAASECQSGSLHLWPEIGLMETFDGDLPSKSSSTGDFVCTGLLNQDMPLIRYRVGDRGMLSSENSCSCGRTLPKISSLEGRSDDVLYTSDGRLIGRLDPVYKAKLSLHEAQIIQESLNRVRVRYVPGANFTRETGQSIIDRLQERMGAVEVVLEEVSTVPRDSNGKFRAVICNLPREQRELRKLQ